MKSRLYDLRSLTPVLFSLKDLNSAQPEGTLKTQEALERQSITDYLGSLPRQSTNFFVLSVTEEALITLDILLLYVAPIIERAEGVLL